MKLKTVKDLKKLLKRLDGFMKDFDDFPIHLYKSGEPIEIVEAAIHLDDTGEPYFSLESA